MKDNPTDTIVTVVALGPRSVGLVEHLCRLSELEDMRLGAPLLLAGGWWRRDFELRLDANVDGKPLRVFLLAYGADEGAQPLPPEPRDVDAALFFPSGDDEIDSAARRNLDDVMARRAGGPPVLIEAVAATSDSAVKAALRSLIKRLVTSLRSGLLVDFAGRRAQEARVALQRWYFGEVTAEAVRAIPTDQLVERLLQLSYERARRAVHEDRVETFDEYEARLPPAWREFLAVNAVEVTLGDGGLAALFGAVSHEELSLAADWYRAHGFPERADRFSEAVALATSENLWAETATLSDRLHAQLEIVEDRLYGADDPVFARLAEVIRAKAEAFALPEFGASSDRG